MNEKKPDQLALRKARASQAAYIERRRQRNDGPHFDGGLMDQFKITEARSDGFLLGEIELGLEYANPSGSMHGAVAALLFGEPCMQLAGATHGLNFVPDVFSSIAFAPRLPLSLSTPEEYDHGPPGGFSRALNVTYLRPLPLPGKCRVQCEVVQDGKRVSFARASLTSMDGKKTYAVCEHHKIKDPGLPERIAGAAKL